MYGVLRKLQRSWYYYTIRTCGSGGGEGEGRLAKDEARRAGKGEILKEPELHTM